MSRAKTRRPGTRSGNTTRRVPTDLPNAAVAALDDLISSTQPFELSDELPTQQRDDIQAKLPPPPPKKASRATSIEDAQLVEEVQLAKIPTLRYAIYEDSAQLASAQGAVVAYRPAEVGRLLLDEGRPDPWARWKAARLSAFRQARPLYLLLVLG